MTDQLTDPTTDDQATLARERAGALRAMADLIEAAPELAGSPYSEIQLNIFPKDADQMAALVRRLGGAREKLDHGTYLTVRRDFGARVVIDIAGQRDQVCEAVVVGTDRTVTTAVACVHCGQGIACTDGVWWHVTGTGWDDRYHACGTRIDDDGNEVGGQPATPPSFGRVSIEERPVTEWRCAPILTSSIGLADARDALTGGRS